MLRSRYFTETLAVGEDPHHPSQRSVLHDMGVTKLTWVRLDENTIMGIAEFPDVLFDKISSEGHETVLMLPSIYDKNPAFDNSGKTISDVKKTSHFDCLKKAVGVTETDTMIDVVAKLIAKGHTFLHPDK